MTIKDLKKLLLEDIANIEFEDFNGNTLFYLTDLDLADVELNGNKQIARLQLKIK